MIMPIPHPASQSTERLALPFPDCGNYKNGAHLQAFYNFQDICADLMQTTRDRYGTAHILDFGTGRYGVGRAIMEPKLQKGDELALYDPKAEISEPIQPDHVHIVDDRMALTYTDGRFNIVNISYVLCLLEPEEARKILSDLSLAHPYAKFLITDYVLRGRENLLEVLNSKEENKWRASIGEEEFRRTHARFDASSLAELVENSGFSKPSGSAWYLDHLGIRETILTEPEPLFCY